MRLFEYQTKHQLQVYGIPIPRHVLVTSYAGARQAIDDLMSDVLLKPQGPRPLPAIQLSRSEPIANILDTVLTPDMTIRSILIEEIIPTKHRVYISLKADRRTGKLVLNANRHDDGNTYEDAKLINPFIGIREYQARDFASNLSLDRVHWQPLMQILQALVSCYIESDAEHIALNPLGITHANRFVVLNAQMHIDNDALQRQPNFYMLQAADPASITEARARQVNITFAKFDGNVSCISGGFGLSLAMLDNIYQLEDTQLRPGQLIDLGNMIQDEKIDVALQSALHDPNIALVLVNLFESTGGEEDIAHKIVSSYEGIPPAKPIIVRLGGPHAQNGLQIIENAGIANVYTETELAAALQIAKELINREHPH
jgi:succinyl-CoA synthetase beta subunit